MMGSTDKGDTTKWLYSYDKRETLRRHERMYACGNTHVR